MRNQGRLVRRAIGGRAPGTPGRIAAVLLAAGLVATGCGGDSGDGGVTLRFSWWGNDERAQITEQAIDAFEKANPGITVETEWVDFEGYFDRLATSVAARDEPDVITMGGAYPSEYADRGVLLDLAEVSGQLDTSVLDETSLVGGQYDGKQYGVPTGVNTFGVIANPAVFKQAGVPMPDDDKWSWEDYVRIAGEISAKTPKGTFGSEDPTDTDTLDLYANQQTGDGLYSTDGGIALQPATLEKWFDLTTGLASSGGTPSANLTAELAASADPAQTLMGQGKAALKFEWSNLIGQYRETTGEDLVLLRAPGETTAPDGTGMWMQASQLYTISKRSEHPGEAAKLVNFLINDPRAAEIIGSDRGIPANPEIRDHLEQDLDETGKVEFEYVDRIAGLVDGHFVIGPTGSTESVDLLQRINQEVLFGRSSPRQGAQKFVEDLTKAVS